MLKNILIVASDIETDILTGNASELFFVEDKVDGKYRHAWNVIRIAGSIIIWM